MIAAVVKLQLEPSLAQLGALFVVLSCGVTVLYALGVLILSLSFRALELQNLTFLMETLLDFAHWPISVFRGPVKLLFTFVLPFAVMTSYPAQSLMGQLEADPAARGDGLGGGLGPDRAPGLDRGAARLHIGVELSHHGRDDCADP